MSAIALAASYDDLPRRGRDEQQQKDESREH
jgi:hypothetical protein